MRNPLKGKREKPAKKAHKTRTQRFPDRCLLTGRWSAFFLWFYDQYGAGLKTDSGLILFEYIADTHG